MCPKYNNAIQIHDLYLASNKESLGKGASVVIPEDQPEKIFMSLSNASLTPDDAKHSNVVKEFLSFPKKKRSKGNALGAFYLGDKVVDVFMMSLNIDEDYLKCKYLFRCHVLFRITDADKKVTYFDSGAHRKFYNMGMEKQPQTMSENIAREQHNIIMVELHKKVSGSQILCVVAPPELQKYFLFLFFSKKGTRNIYSDLGATAFKSYVQESGLTLAQVHKILTEKSITSMTFEVMGVDRHVSMDQDSGSLILHGTSFSNGMKMSMLDQEKLAEELKLDVVKTIFRSSSSTSFQEAMEAYENYNVEGNTNEGCVMTITYVSQLQKLKCKTFWYLYLRDYREAIPKGSRAAETAPTINGQIGRLIMFGTPSEKHLELARKFVLWWLWVRSNECDESQLALLELGDHPLVIDHFLGLPDYQNLDSAKYLKLYDRLVTNQRRKPHLIPLPINVGLMGSGKSTTSKGIATTISQDQCGGNRQNLVKEIVNYFLDPSIPFDEKLVVVDRTNLSKSLRSQLLWDLNLQIGKSALKEYVLLIPVYLCHTSPGFLPGQLPEQLVDRFIANRVSAESHESLTLEGTGTLSTLEILRSASYQLELPDQEVEAIHFNLEDDVETKVLQFQKWFRKRFPNQVKRLNTVKKHKYSVSTKYTPSKPNMKVSYAGWGTPFHNSISNPVLREHFDGFLTRNKDLHPREYNSHVTKIYGAKHVEELKIDEGRKKTLVCIGTFERTRKVCGSIVLAIDIDPFPESVEFLWQLPLSTVVYHITGWTTKGTEPAYSNTVLNGVTKTLENKPRLGSLLDLFTKEQLEWSETFDQETGEATILRLFDKPKPIIGYEGIFKRR